jgi:hypothetical protein
VTLVLTGLLLVLKLRDPLPDRPSHRFTELLQN